MPGRRRGAVRKGKGTMCNICGKNCGKGAALASHLRAHDIDHPTYKRCFYGDVKTVLCESWDDSVRTSAGQTVVTHVLVRRFITDPGPRGATRTPSRAV
jgi:hypothetical protein